MRLHYKLVSLSILLAACQQSKSDSIQVTTATKQAKLAEQYFQSSSTIAVQVWYQATAEPYTKQNLTDRDYWGILRENLAAIMQYRSTPPTINVPSSLNEMNVLPVAKQDNWTSAQIIDLAEAHNNGTAETGTSTFYIFFLDGYFNKGAGSDKNILGVSLSGTNILAMFKPVVASTSTGLADIIPKYVEQSTLVHELGHALGFVNNGVPMVSNYQDEAHGAHSNNEEDVMFWLNEGASDLQKFVVKYIQSQSAVMWGPEVLADAKAISK